MKIINTPCDEVARLYSEGLSFEQIALRKRVGSETIRKLLAGTKVRADAREAANYKWALIARSHGFESEVEMFEVLTKGGKFDRWQTRELAAIAGCTTETISIRLRKLGIPPLKRGGWNKGKKLVGKGGRNLQPQDSRLKKGGN